jgi:hypothetical protein
MGIKKKKISKSRRTKPKPVKPHKRNKIRPSFMGLQKDMGVFKVPKVPYLQQKAHIQAHEGI